VFYVDFAALAHLVERNLAKVEVASSSLVSRSKTKILSRLLGRIFVLEPQEYRWQAV
jgi:hypothetical protein